MAKKILERQDVCCGCGACANICGHDAIAMREARDGFLYPVIDAGKCVDCGMCKSHCPILIRDQLQLPQHHIDNYAAYMKDSEELLQSASGGAAAALMKAVIQQDGVVFGVAYTGDYRGAVTVKADTLTELSRLKDSKYMQSVKGDCYRQVRSELLRGKTVLYMGTPCEIGALKAFLGKEYDNLYTCELICHATTTRRVARIYLDEWEKKRHSKVTGMSVRCKDRGWSVPHIRLDFENGGSMIQEFYQSEYGQAFVVWVRPSCHQCRYRGDHKVADITVGDFWGVKKEDSYWNPNGVSAISVHTPKGRKLLSMTTELELFPVSYDTIRKGNHPLEQDVPYDRAFRLFRKGACTIGLRKTVRLYHQYRELIRIIKRVWHKRNI
jgi:coenzyme F420-reducing hydrogenase beta subunit